MPVFQLLYASGAVGDLKDSELAEILRVSRSNNSQLGVTGVLLHANGTFIQVLEGDAAVVRTLAGRISRDPRHRNYMVLLEKESDSRAFAEWSMGFKKLDTTHEAGSAIFETTRAALESRIARTDDGILFDAVLAFCGRDFLADA